MKNMRAWTVTLALCAACSGAAETGLVGNDAGSSVDAAAEADAARDAAAPDAPGDAPPDASADAAQDVVDAGVDSAPIDAAPIDSSPPDTGPDACSPSVACSGLECGDVMTPCGTVTCGTCAYPNVCGAAGAQANHCTVCVPAPNSNGCLQSPYGVNYPHQYVCQMIPGQFMHYDLNRFGCPGIGACTPSTFGSCSDYCCQ